MKLFFGASLLCILGGCGASPDRPVRTPLAERDQSLFDDGIEAGAAGLNLVDPENVRTAALDERIKRADLVAKVRLQTITKSGRDQETYRLTLTPVGAPIVKRADASAPYIVDAGKASFGLLRNLESQLVGQSFILFLKTYSEGEHEEPHFHLAPDHPMVSKVIADTLAREPLKK